MFDRMKFCEYEDFFQKEHLQSFELLDGKGPVMISAPHSVEQLRNNQIKFAEPQTGVLAKMLHDALDCPVIYKTKNCDDDANFDKVSPYKQALAEYIKNNNIAFLIDLHQLSPTRDVHIVIGTGKFKNVSCAKFVDVAVNSFKSKNISRIQIDDPFEASYPFTVSSYISSLCNISCLQIEIHSNLVRINTKESKVEQIFEALITLITNLSKILQGD